MTVSPGAGQRVTVILIPKAEADLRRLQERTNLSRTDLTNRAISLYEFFDAQLRAGRDLVTLDKETGQAAKVLVRLPDAQEGQALAARQRRRLFPSPFKPGWPTPKLA